MIAYNIPIIIMIDDTREQFYQFHGIQALMSRLSRLHDVLCDESINEHDNELLLICRIMSCLHVSIMHKSRSSTRDI